MIQLIFTAIGVGLVLSLLAGPAFFALITTNIRFGFKAGVYFASGIFVGDSIYIIITIYSIYLIKSIQHIYHNLFSLVGGSFLLIIGLHYLIKKSNIEETTNNISEVPSSYIKHFIKGFFMNILNPAVLLYWMAVSTRFVHQLTTRTESILFFMVTILTMYSLDIFKSYLISHYRNRIKFSYIGVISKVCGGVIVAYAVKLIASVFW